MMVLGAFKGHLTPEIKATLTDEHRPCSHVGQDDITTEVARCCGKQTIE
jgi:hypothetical protein